MAESLEPTLLKTLLTKEHLRLLVKPEELPQKKRFEKEPKTLIRYAEKKPSRIPYLIPDSSRNLHLYISGKPGTGKSTLPMNLVLKDILCGKGCCVIDPHGDLIENILERISDKEKYEEKIIIFDPSDLDYPVGLNILQDITEDEQDSTVQFVISLFDKLYIADQMGPMCTKTHSFLPFFLTSPSFSRLF
jgi:hypothetical protein